jgi:uncharacterized membrane protein
MEMFGNRMHRVILTAGLIALVATAGQAATVSVAVYNKDSGAALSGAVVAIVSGETVVASGRTNAQGAWSGNVADGRVTVLAAKDLHVTQARAATVSGNGSMRFDLLQHKQEDFKRLGRIVGFVRSATGVPLANATLVLLKGKAPVGVTQPENASGVYDLEWYAPGSYSVVASAPGHSAKKFTGQTISAGESLWLDVTLQPK